jgi:radical SAM protein with 4Fe4S-binding SPASM domain
VGWGKKFRTLRSPRRMINHLAKELEVPARAETLHYFPTKITIETGNVCNLRCPLCPTGTSETKVPKGMLTFDRFKHIIGQLGPTTETLDFFDWGEPFLNKELLPMVTYTKKRFPHVRVVISSNLNIPHFTEAAAAEVVQSGLDHLIMSVDGATQSVYATYRVGGQLETVLRNMRWLLKAKTALRVKHPTLVWNYLVFRHNEHEVEAARRLAAGIGVEFTAGPMRTDCGEEIFLPLDERLKRDGSWIPKNPTYSQYSHEALSRRVNDCAKPWKTTAINWDGYVVPCGSVYDCRTYNFGNIFEQSFKDIWNGERYRSARRALAKGAAGTQTICETCKKNGFPLYA